MTFTIEISDKEEAKSYFIKYYSDSKYRVVDINYNFDNNTFVELKKMYPSKEVRNG